jgi:hypothetical protein
MRVQGDPTDGGAVPRSANSLKYLYESVQDQIKLTFYVIRINRNDDDCDDNINNDVFFPLFIFISFH